MTSLFAAQNILAQTAPAAAPSSSQGLLSFLPMVLIFAAMYFLMIAPQRKKQKELQKMLAALDTGDEVITSGGIYGEITNKKDDRFVIRIADNTKIEVGKGFVTAVVKKAGASK
jgi:preprotein translocase subunit YajC